MSLFQNSIVTKYTQLQNQETVAKKWELFKLHFHNSEIQQNIRNAKEEQYQGGFLIDLFVNVFDYVKNPSPKFNLTTEYKNVKDSKKADGAIIINNVVKAVIELKGTETTDLGKVESQAFGYKNNQPSCNYVITSNFEKLRFYVDNAIEFIEFNLFTLTKAEFDLLFTLLYVDNMAKDIPKQLKKQSVSQEDAITKNLYKDYSLFKRELHQNLVQHNKQFDALLLFKKSQKLLDRFLFLFFAEDRQLLPPNSVRLVLKQWKQLQDLDEQVPLYNRFKKYFNYLNTGFKGKQFDVYPYNGGLFKPDEILDQILIDDDLLYKHTLKLSEYDFQSEVDVNILGHIFENSLNELEEIQAQLEGQEIDKTKTKRKKDGVFYTPKYITKYIVENTVGKLCEEKKTKLDISDETYKPAKNRSRKRLERLQQYREWLLQLTICDPACGSGAFLNQALDFLINEHKYIDELSAKYNKDTFVLSDVEKSILENNLFGVDLNDESVEIAKLSLWLRTAQPYRKLNDLSNNIKCGNSLIDDVTVAGEKAFNWQREFPQIFKQKNKKAFHITTAVHDSRTSQRMIDYKVREKRDLGTNPYPNITYFTNEDDYVITQTIATIVKEDQLNVLAYNICGDHIHLLLVCEEHKVSKIVQKIKSITSKIVHRDRATREHAPLATETNAIETKHAPLGSQKSLAKHTNKPLWTQKYGCKQIVTEKQLTNTIQYIKTNRAKHNLPPHTQNKGVCSIGESQSLGNTDSHSAQHATHNKGACSLGNINNTDNTQHHQHKTVDQIINSMVCTIEKAFENQYSGGFDVVIGNPPYVPGKSIENNLKLYFKRTFKLITGKYDLYILFTEKIMSLIKPNGYWGIIIPNTVLVNENSTLLRKNIIQNKLMSQVRLFKDDVFPDASVESVVLISGNNEKNIKLVDYEGSYYGKTDLDFIKSDKFYRIQVSLTNEDLKVLSKIETQSIKLSEISEICIGIQIGGTGKSKDFKEKNISTFQKDSNYKKFLDGKDFEPYKINWSGSFLNYGNWLHRKRDEKYFLNDKIIIRQIGASPIGTIDRDNYYVLNTIYSLILKDNTPFKLEYVYSIINSKLIKYYWRKLFSDNKTLFPKIKKSQLVEIPIKNLTKLKQLSYLEKVSISLSLNKELQEVSTKFQRTIQRKFELEKLPKKLQDWYLLPFADFVKELKKKKIKLTLSEEAEWEDYFLAEQQKAKALKTKIEATDKQINAMVYKLYGLTEDEIAIVEGSN